MWRWPGLSVAIATAFIIVGAGPVGAQGSADLLISNKLRGNDYETSRSRLRVNRPKANALDELGYPIADGIIISPSVRVETGYDSNPDELFREDATAFGLVDGSLVLGFVKPGAATTLAIKGSAVSFEGLPRSDRWDAGVALDSYYVFPFGLEVSGGAFYLRDAISFTESDSTAAYYKLDYSNKNIATYAEGSINQVRYLSQQPIASTVPANLRPFLFNSEFNHLRIENKAGLLVGRDRVLAVFTEGGYAWVDFIDQKVKNTVDRDADEYWISGGVRLTFAPHIRADLGYRYNRRDLRDTTVSSHEADYIDGKILWRPVQNLQASFEVDRSLGQPSSALSLVREITKYGVSIVYVPTRRTTLSARAWRRRIREIGDNVIYRERKFLAEAAYDINSKTQFYLNGLLEWVKEEISQGDYQRYRIGIGIRRKFNAAEEDPWSYPLSDLSEFPFANKLVTASFAYGHLILPALSMTTITDPFLTQSLRRIEDHDGHFGGPRIDFAIGDISGRRTDGAYATWLNLKGFYGHYDVTQRSTCNFTLAFDCVFINIQDPNLAAINNTGPFGRLSTRTRRQVHHFGGAIEAPLGRQVIAGSLKDPEPTTLPSLFKFGLSIKGILQDNDLFAIDVSVPDPVDYREELDTYYYGAYLGLEKHYGLGRGLTLSVNAEAGLYFAETDYHGRYLAFFPVGGGANFVTDQGVADLRHEQASFIGTLRLDLNKTFDWGNVGVFGEAEYYSYAPSVRYNDNDLAGGPPFDLVGAQVGTQLRADSAFSFAVGGRVTVPFNQTP